MLKSLIEELK
jgi:hypothetical protein